MAQKKKGRKRAPPKQKKAPVIGNVDAGNKKEETAELKRNVEKQKETTGLKNNAKEKQKDTAGLKSSSGATDTLTAFLGYLERNPNRLFKISDYKVEEILGVGGFGRVHRVLHSESQHELSLKILSKTEVPHKMLEDEGDLHEKLCHPNVIHMFGRFDNLTFYDILMEYAEGGDLLQLLEDRFKNNEGPFQEDTVSQWTYQIASGLHYLHEKQIYHRDLKLENILLSKGKCKIADMGLAAQVKTRRTRFSVVGTISFMAPEILLEAGHTRKADFWSLGVVLFELLVGTSPFVRSKR